MIRNFRLLIILSMGVSVLAFFWYFVFTNSLVGHLKRSIAKQNTWQHAFNKSLPRKSNSWISEQSLFKEKNRNKVRVEELPEIVVWLQHQIKGQDEEIEWLKTRLRLQRDPQHVGNNNSTGNTIEVLSEKIQSLSNRLKYFENQAYIKRYTKRITSIKAKAYAGLKLVHMDLKGAPPNVDYFTKFIRYAKIYGASGLLIEYEDMFPWSDTLSHIARQSAYTRKDIETILKTAKDFGLEVIPLIQTFGHLEFLLKHKTFKELTRDGRDIKSINPAHKKSVPLIKQMIDQVFKLHPDIRYFHVGGDEVEQMGYCEGCSKLEMTSTEIYLHHMIPILKYVKSKQNNNGISLTPIIWDDMLRSWESEDLKKIVTHAIPMIWGYVEDLSKYRSFPQRMWNNYVESFTEVFVASSFKGADEQRTNFMRVDERANNNYQWLKYITLLQNVGINVKGIALTGWSRFTHELPMCELLPVGTPTLVLCLNILNTGRYDDSLILNVSRTLGVIDLVDRLSIQERFSYPLKQKHVAKFYGAEVLMIVERFERIRAMTKNMKQYNVEKGSITQVEELQEQLKHLRQEAINILQKYFFDDTVKEWVREKIDAEAQYLTVTRKRFIRQLELEDKHKKKTNKQHKRTESVDELNGDLTRDEDEENEDSKELNKKHKRLNNLDDLNANSNAHESSKRKKILKGKKHKNADHNQNTTMYTKGIKQAAETSLITKEEERIKIQRPLK